MTRERTTWVAERFCPSLLAKPPDAMSPANDEMRCRTVMAAVGSLMHCKLADDEAMEMNRALECANKSLHRYAYELACGETTAHALRDVRRQARSLKKAHAMCHERMSADKSAAVRRMCQEVAKIANDL